MITDEAAEYFRNRGGFQRAFAIMKQKYQSYGRLGGEVLLKDPSAEERKDLGGYFGRDYAQGPIRFTLHQFEAGLAETKFGCCSLYEILCVYYHETIRTNKEEKEAEEQGWKNRLHNFRKGAEEIDGNGPGKLWADGLDVNQYKACVRLFHDPAEAEHQMLGCIKAMHFLSRRQAAIRLSVLAMEAMADPHGLDRNLPAGRLFLKMLQQKDHNSRRLDSEETLDLYIRHGIRPDDISSFTVVQGMHFYDEKGLHPAYEGHLERQEYYLLSLSQLQNITSVMPVHQPVHIIENQMVYAEICSHLPSASILCTSGQMKTASLLVVDMLAEKKIEMYYSSDLDPEGIGMAERLCERHPSCIHPWHMDLSDYEKSMSDQVIDARRLKMLEHVSHPALSAVSKKLCEVKRAGYQEKLIDVMIEDIRKNQNLQEQ